MSGGRYGYVFGKYIPDFRVHRGYRGNDQMRADLRSFAATSTALRDLAYGAPGVVKFIQAYSTNTSSQTFNADVHVVNEETVDPVTRAAYTNWLDDTARKIDDDIFRAGANITPGGPVGGSGIVNFTIGPGGGGGGGGYVTHTAVGPGSVTVVGADPSTQVSRTVSVTHFDKALAEMKQEIIQQVCDELQTILAPLLKGLR